MKSTAARTFRKTMLAGIVAATLSSCSGGESSGSDQVGGRSGSGNGLFTLNITDAVVDSVDEVWVHITSIDIKHADGPPVNYPLEGGPATINLLSLQNGLFQTLLSSIELKSGVYDWIRLNVTGDIDGNFDSYIVLDDASSHELRVVSTTGLQINNPMVLAEGSHEIKMIDFDLRRSIIYASGPGEYHIRPVLRFIDQDSGTISGSVDPALLMSATNCSDLDPNTYNAVYIYEGFDAKPGDIKGTPSDAYTSASISLNPGTGKYEYHATYLPYGDYTVAYTCQADLDDPDQNDSIVFFGTHNITVARDINIIR